MYSRTMKPTYDFTNATIGPVVQTSTKTRITIHVDNDVLAAFKEKAAQQGKGYQTMINDSLRQLIASQSEPVTEEILRRVIREELKTA